MLLLFQFPTCTFYIDGQDYIVNAFRYGSNRNPTLKSRRKKKQLTIRFIPTQYEYTISRMS